MASMPPTRERSGRSPTGFVATAPTRASWAPLALGAIAVAASLAIAVYVVMRESAAVTLLGVPVPLVTPGSAWLSLVGYLLTPVIVIACYGWDAIGQRNGRRKNRNFVGRPTTTRFLLWACGAGVLIGAWHVLNLSVPLSEAWGWT